MVEHHRSDSTFIKFDSFFLRDPGSNSNEAERVEAGIKTACIDFEKKIASGTKPEIESYLKDIEKHSRTNLVARLIMLEVRYRVMNGDSPSIDEYIQRFPEESETINSLKSYFEFVHKELAAASNITIKHIHELFKVIHRFELRSEIGSGAFGNVWLAWDTKLKRYVAVKTFEKKTMLDEGIDPVLHEAMCTAQLNHPNIVSIFDYGMENDIGFLVMEYLPHGDMKDVLKRGPLNIQQAAEICYKIANALHYAHNVDEPVIHRDIKPSNILLDVNNEPKLVDFGIARSDVTDKTITKHDKLLGTPAYMSPEQIRNTGVGPWSDVYSLGVVLFEFLTARQPFTGGLRDILVSIQFQDIPRLRTIRKDIPVDLETICVKATAKLKKDRYQSAQAFAHDLQLFLSNQPIHAKPLTTGQKLWRKAKRSPIVSTLVLLMLISLGVTSYAMAMLVEKVPEGMLKVDIDSTPHGTSLVIVPLDPIRKTLQIEKTLRPRNLTPFSLNLKPGNYQITATVGDADSEAEFNTCFRFVPATSNTIPNGFTNPKRYKQIGSNHIEWKVINVKQSMTNIDMQLIDLNEYAEEDVVKEYCKTNKNCLNHKFYISKDVFRYKDLFDLRPKISKTSSQGQHHPEELLLGGFNDACHWAEESGYRLPIQAEYEMVKIFMQMIAKYHPESSEEMMVSGLDDEQWEWTQTFVKSNLLDGYMSVDGLGWPIDYLYVAGTSNETVHFRKDGSSDIAFRLCRSVTSGPIIE